MLTPDALALACSTLESSSTRFCPYRVLEAQSGSILAQVQQAQNVILWYLYAPVPRSMTSAERNEQIRRRHAAGESYSELARVFNITSQRIGQIIHRRHR